MKTSHIMNLNVRLNKVMIEKKYHDIQGAWIMSLFVMPLLLAAVRVLAPGFPVLALILGGIISVVMANRSWKELKTLRPLRKLPELFPADEFLNLLRDISIGHEVSNTGDEERPQRIRFYQWVEVPEEGHNVVEMKTLASYDMNYTMSFSIKEILPFIDMNKVPKIHRDTLKVIPYVE